ncbi:MAG: FtsX-like permease family protein [Campylobacterales bacterium]|nr:FtsX-like permease family protein [Campylobacterales bacterium]
MRTLFDYTLHSLGRFGRKNLLIGVIFTFLVWLLSASLMITHSLKHAFLHSASSLPELTVQQLQGGQTAPISPATLEPFWGIAGVSMVQGRVWGMYYLELDKLYVTLVGIEPYAEQYNALASSAHLEEFNTPFPPLLTSPSLVLLLKKYMSGDSLSFLKHGGGFERLTLAGTFDHELSLLSNDVILMPMAQARAILGLPQGCTDAFIKVLNEEEIGTVASKIAAQNPTLRILSKEALIQRYLNLYDMKGGWFLALSLVCFVTFAMILYDKASGLSSQEKREIGILKALGWEVEHIIKHKLTEAALISVGGFLVGFTLALGYVFFLDAPLLRLMFTGYSALRPAFSLPFSLDVPLFFLLFFATVPLYLAASIIPAWKASVEDAGEVMR